MKKRNNKKIYRINRILIILSICVITYTTFNLISINLDVKEKKENIDQLSEEINQQQNINQELTDTVEEGATREAIAKVAKDKLGLVLPGERVIVDIGSK